MRIRMEGDCRQGPDCEPIALKTYAELSTGAYNWPCSVVQLPDDLDGFYAAHKTARKRASRAQGLGYRFEQIDRSLYERDVDEINLSKPVRQGRPMSAGYQEPVKYSPLSYSCRRHAINFYGVLEADSLRAYCWVYRVGQLVMVNTILGHAEHLERDVMYLLMAGVFRAEQKNGEGFVFYNMHSGGTDGLRFYKERWGFEPTRVEWSLA